MHLSMIYIFCPQHKSNFFILTNSNGLHCTVTLPWDWWEPSVTSVVGDCLPCHGVFWKGQCHIDNSDETIMSNINLHNHFCYCCERGSFCPGLEPYQQRWWEIFKYLSVFLRQGGSQHLSIYKYRLQVLFLIFKYGYWLNSSR